MLSRDSEDEMWSRFVFELVIWPQEVALARWTQPSGPLCLWQCFVHTLSTRFGQDFEVEVQERFWSWSLVSILLLVFGWGYEVESSSIFWSPLCFWQFLHYNSTFFVLFSTNKVEHFTIFVVFSCKYSRKKRLYLRQHLYQNNASEDELKMFQNFLQGAEYTRNH